MTFFYQGGMHITHKMFSIRKCRPLNVRKSRKCGNNECCSNKAEYMCAQLPEYFIRGGLEGEDLWAYRHPSWWRGGRRTAKAHQDCLVSCPRRGTDICSLDGRSSIIREFRAVPNHFSTRGYSYHHQLVHICKHSECADKNWLKVTGSTCMKFWNSTEFSENATSGVQRSDIWFWCFAKTKTYL